MRAGLAALDRRGDVEDHDLVDALDVVAPRQRGGIAGIAQPFEVHALDDLAVANVEAGDDPLRQHPSPSSYARQLLSESRRPASPDFSGWNCTADTLSRSTAALNGTPYSQIAARVVDHRCGVGVREVDLRSVLDAGHQS